LAMLLLRSGLHCPLNYPDGFALYSNLWQHRAVANLDPLLLKTSIFFKAYASNVT
jgi:hypothetical protein